MNNKKTTWVFSFYKYGKFWSVLLDKKVDLKPLFSEECHIISSSIHKSLIYEEWLELKYLVGHFFRIKKIVLWLFHKHRYLGYLGLHKICHFVTLCPQYKTCIQSTKYQFWSGVRVFSLPTHELSRTVSYNLDWSM